MASEALSSINFKKKQPSNVANICDRWRLVISCVSDGMFSEAEVKDTHGLINMATITKSTHKWRA